MRLGLVAAIVFETSAWGGDVNPGAGAKLVEDVRRELRNFVLAPARDRAGRARTLVAKRATEAIEGWKRFRNPELVELARACLAHEDWHVAHRGLLWLRALGDEEVLARAWPLSTHAEPRMREMAVLTCLHAWDSERAVALLGDKARESIDRRLVEESDPHVRSALRALARRADGKLAPIEIAKEVVVKESNGLLWTPFVRGLRTLEEVAPGVEIPGTERFGDAFADGGDGSAANAANAASTANAWVAPLLGYGTEEVSRIRMQGFGNPRQEGALVHTGQDVGGCCDGAGLYALADGVVKLVDAGHDAGVRLVIQHRRSGDEFVNAIYMHAAYTLFVDAGEAVTAGQLLGTIGLSFSIENGGQFAHLHFGLYRGPFRRDHNHGYQSASLDLGNWIDPAQALAEWIR